jgi:hypothetical protein
MACACSSDAAAAAAAAHRIRCPRFAAQSVLDLVCLGIGMMLGELVYADLCSAYQQHEHHCGQAVMAYCPLHIWDVYLEIARVP